MNNKTRLVIVLALLIAVLSGCAAVSSGKLDSMFRNQSAAVANDNDSGQSNDISDTVIISLDEYEQLIQFSELVELINDADQNFYKEIDREKMIEYAAKGLMAGLDDPYSFYYTPEEFQEMWEDDEGNYTGIGVLINANYTTQTCTIIRVFQNSPAAQVGVLRGDILYRVGEDMYVTADNLSDAVDIMRGLPGTDVDVTFLRNGEEITYTITRQQVNVNQVESKMLDDSVGYLALYQFAGECEKEFENAVNDLVSQGAKGLIIDLRDNPGGWVDQARYMADLFMDEGEACYLVYRDGREDHTQYRTYDGKVDIPLVILVNENSASSSEILTGALKDRADAVVVGVQSFGKGIVQGVMSVGTRGAGVQITVAQYFTPDGNAVHGIGIAPDVEVPLEDGDNGMYDFADINNDPQLKKSYEVMLEKLK